MCKWHPKISGFWNLGNQNRLRNRSALHITEKWWRDPQKYSSKDLKFHDDNTPLLSPFNSSYPTIYPTIYPTLYQYTINILYILYQYTINILSIYYQYSEYTIIIAILTILISHYISIYILSISPLLFHIPFSIYLKYIHIIIIILMGFTLIGK